MPHRGRTSNCSRHDAATRLKQAMSFAELAEIADTGTDTGPERSAAVSNAVLAGVAAADAICCVRLGLHASGDDHYGAARLLREVADVGQEAAASLSTLLGLKQKAQYAFVDPSRGEATRALRAMRNIIDLARTVV